jgi:hypothetical protein
MEMINWTELSYLFKSQLILSVSALIYVVLIRNERFFIVNRIYLLFTLTASLVLPLFSFTEPVLIEEIILLPEVVVTAQSIEGIQQSVNWFFWIYVTISILLFSRLIYAYFRWKSSISESTTPHSFFQFIYVPEQHADRDVLFKHERVHVEHWHSMDTLFVALYKVVFWINPVSHLYAKWISENHEYTADSIAAKGIGRKRYAEILVGETFSLPGFNLTDSFYKPSLTKNRIAMLFKNKSPKQNLIKYLLILPVLVALLFVPACTEEKIVEIPDESEEQTANSKALPVFNVELAPGTPDCIDATGEDRMQCFVQSVTNHIIENFVYPSDAKENGIEGRIFVQFIIDDQGKVGNIEAVRIGATPSDNTPENFDEAQLDRYAEMLSRSAVEVVSSMPDFIPAQNDGKDVSVQFTVPIRYAVK